MADKKMVEAITSMEEDFAQWYTDVVKKAELCDYTSVKGCMVIKPAGYAIWELIQKELDARFKAVGVQNVYLPMFIPESLLDKEKDHVEGFAPEVAWVTQGGLNELPERLCVRPTSETLFCDFYKNDIHSYRDLPKVYNQWCSVVRWEKETRPFLRSREFLWQEGHTAHATAEESQERTLQMLNVYAKFLEEVLAIPAIKGQKTEKEKFAGAIATYTVEALMHDGKALQSGTSHNFGDGFAKAFGIFLTHIFTVVDADQLAVLIDHGADGFFCNGKNILSDSEKSVIAKSHDVALMDLFLIDVGITYRVRYLTGFHHLDALCHGLLVLFCRFLRHIADHGCDALRNGFGRNNDCLLYTSPSPRDTR